MVPPRGGTPDWGPYESHSCSLGRVCPFVGINSSVSSRFAHDVGGEVRLPTIFVRSFWGSGKGLPLLRWKCFRGIEFTRILGHHVTRGSDEISQFVGSR